MPDEHALYTTFLMLTEALKGAGVARFIAKGASLPWGPSRAFAKGVGPDPKFDRRGKQFEHATFLNVSRRATKIKRFMTEPPSNANGHVDRNHVYVDKVWTVAFWEQQFVSNRDVVRDVRKKKLVEPTLPNHKTGFKTQKALLELWIVILNVLDFIKDFLNRELEIEALRYHDAGIAVLQNLRDTKAPIDQPRLEAFLTKDLRQTRVAVLHTASEFQFYAAAADWPRRIFFSMDIRDLGVDVLQLYERSGARITDKELKGRALLEETLRSTDDIAERRRLTYELVVQTFRRYYALLANSAKMRRTDGTRESARAFGAPAAPPTLPPFDDAVQIMLGGDEVFVAAHPHFAAYVHNIIGDLDTTTYKDRGLNMRTCVAFSKARTADPASKQREENRRSHHQAMKLADEAHGVLKRLERTHRRIERLIDKLAGNPTKKAEAPKFTERLQKLGLIKLFVRVHHGMPVVLAPKEFARLLGHLKVGDCKDVELVDFAGKVLDCPRLISDAAALEKDVTDKVGRDNERFEPPPMYGKKPKKEDPDKDDPDKEPDR